MADASNDPHTTSSSEPEPPDKQGDICHRKPPKRSQFRKGIYAFKIDDHSNFVRIGPLRLSKNVPLNAVAFSD